MSRPGTREIDNSPKKSSARPAAIIRATMSYLEAFKVGWSILWRKAAWLAAAGACLLAVHLYLKSAQLTIGLAVSMGLVLLFYVFPRILQHLTAIEYNDFRLAVTRGDDRQ